MPLDLPCLTLQYHLLALVGLLSYNAIVFLNHIYCAMHRYGASFVIFGVLYLMGPNKKCKMIGP